MRAFRTKYTTIPFISRASSTQPTSATTTTSIVMLLKASQCYVFALRLKSRKENDDILLYGGLNLMVGEIKKVICPVSGGCLNKDYHCNGFGTILCHHDDTETKYMSKVTERSVYLLICLIPKDIPWGPRIIYSGVLSSSNSLFVRRKSRFWMPQNILIWKRQHLKFQPPRVGNQRRSGWEI